MNIFKKAASDIKQNKANGNTGPVSFISSVLSGNPKWSNNDYRSHVLEGYKKSWVVYRCIRERAQALGSAKIKVYQKKKDKEEDEYIPDHPLQLLLNKPNPFYSAQTLKEFWEMSRCLSGDAYWQLARLDSNNRPEEIYYLRPDRIKIIPDKTEYIKGYKYIIGNKKFDLMPEQVLHCKMLDPIDQYNGMSPIEAGSRTIDISNKIQDWNKVFFDNAARPNGAFVTDDNLNNESFDRMNEQIKKKRVGIDNAHKPLLLEGGVKWQEIERSHKDMDFPSLKNMTRQDICDLFSVPTVLISNRKEDGSTYNNKREARRYFWEDTVLPEVDDLTDQINNNLAPNYGDDIYVKVAKEEIPALRENQNEKEERINKRVENNIITLNEARRELDYNEEDWGDTTLAEHEAKLKAGMQTSSKKKTFLIDNNPVKTDIFAQKQELLIDYIDNIEPDKKTLKTVSNNLFKEDITLEHAKLWFDYVKAMIPFENKFNRLATRLFAEQEQEVLDNLNQLEKSKKPTETKQINEDNIDDILFEIDEQNEYFATEAGPVLRDTVQVFGSDALSTAGVAIDFDLENPRVAEFLNSKKITFSENVNDTTVKKLRSELVEGVRAGEGIPELSKRVEDVYSDAKGYRSELISRTEVNTVANRGSLEGYKISGVTEQKQWLAALDERTRSDHRQANGQTVDIDKDFTVGGYSMNAPGDPSAPANQVCNCRCNLLPIVKKG